MRRRAAGASTFTIGLAAIVIIVVATYLGFSKDLPFVDPPHEIRAAFRDSSGIKPNSPVRIAGVDVGTVTNVEHTSPGSRAAMVTMDIEERGRPIRQDAEAKIRPRIFLEGNFFVDLQPGTPSSPELEEGAAIPIDRTASPVQFDQVLKVLKRDTRGDLKAVFREVGVAQSAGGAKAFNRSLEHQPDAYRFSAVVAEALLGEEPGDLGDWIRDQGVVSAALDRNPQQLRALIVNFNQTAAALADREDDLRDAVAELPTTLRAAMPAFDALNDAFPFVRRFAVAARPGIRSTGPAVDAVLPLVRQLRGLVGAGELRGLSEDLREATPDLAKLADESVPLLQETRKLASCTSNVLVPNANQTVPDPNFPASGPVHQEFPKGLPGIGGETRSFDANGQYLKVIGTGGAETVSLGGGLFGTSLTPLIGVNPPYDRTHPPLRRDVPCETQEIPNLNTETGDPPPSSSAANDSPAAKARYAKAQKVALEFERRKLKQHGLDVEIGDREATLRDIEAVARRTGRLEQFRKTLPGKK